MKIHYQQAVFLTSAAKLNQLPADSGIEVAFAGRSNAGKSSALNVLTRNKKLAFTSKTPGRTQLINLFSLDEERRLVDLPGYGYAKVPLAVKQRWQATLGQYLEQRQCLRGLILLMDIRHPLKEFDVNLLNWSTHCQFGVHILLTKSDKLSRGAADSTYQQVLRDLSHLHLNTEVSCQIFSAHSLVGVDKLQAKLNEWFDIPHADESQLKT
jgi:GTP-binding protein